MTQLAPLPIAPTPNPALPEGEKGPPIVLQYWEIARRHLWLILSIVGVTLVAGIVITLLLTPRYTATARIEIQREQANVGNVQTLQPEQNAQNLEFYQTQYSLLNARSLAERVAKKLRLAQNQQFLEAHDLEGGLFASGKTPTRQELRKREDKVVDTLLDNISISPVRGSALVDVSYISPSPALAAQISNTWVEEFISQSMDRRFASTADARGFLETRLQSLRERLEQSERELVNYAEKRNIVPLAETRSEDGRTTTGQTLLGADIASLNAELVSATAHRVAAEGQMDAARVGGSNSDTIANTAINNLRASRAEKAAQYAELMVRFDPEYPQARALQQQIAKLDQAIANEERRVLSATTTNYNAARQREEGLRARLDQLLGKLQGQNRATIEYNIHQRDVDTNRQLYDGLLQRYKEIGAVGVGTNNIAIVDPAIVPENQSSPKLVLNLALALLTGIALAGATVFVRENLDEGLRSPQQVSDLLGIPLLGTIPSSEKGEPLELIEDPKSILNEAYMALHTNLGFVSDHGFPRSMAFTSSVSSEGKSTSSYALARLLARAGKSVLLVDIDLRRPRLAKLLDMKAPKGMSNYLAGDNDWRSMIHTTGVDRLSLLPAGPIPPSAPELLHGPRLSVLMQELLQHYDHVILDSPPLLGLADAPLIAVTVEGVVLVIEARRVPIRAIRASVQRLASVNAHIFGAVVTRYRANVTSYGYGYDYANLYSYESDKQASTVR
ncbi:polysaccharide biosynthesis tyrosine autokinase [Caenibius sp. WL]|uniref:GumC family protein n=1 Tax=Caenibius sp. WL TaxID=2872646 RepID=UPI001C9973D2|nr:polysaccharide biosynthesis tyrosine autokinase [Caenibius sp. WL]QZP08988.1 polysaccharide biosynthesis tyrosine autokinase [Caenibius sp. WL]